MSLEVDKIAPQAEILAKELSCKREEQGKALKLARETLEKLGPEQEALKRKLEGARATWLVAEPLESLDCFPLCPPPPSDYLAVAVDGSHLSSERYSLQPYFLINLGVSMLVYGAEPGAKLFSTPRLYSKPAELAIKDPSGKERDIQIVGPLLGIKRQVEEAAYLVDLAENSETDRGPVLALADGSLVLWGMEAQKFPSFVEHALLDNGLLKAFEKIRTRASAMANGKLQTANSRQQTADGEQNKTCGIQNTGQIAIASYISASGSSEVVNLLRLYLCPYEPVNCDKYCGDKERGEKECDVIQGPRDAALFAALLEPGQRSPLFGCRSSIMKYYGEHRVCFFYLKLDDEVARIEMPWWAAKKENLVSLVHALVFDQCQRGLGYPVVLSEAHERAVLRAEDRNLFQSMLEELCQEKNLHMPLSAKDSSKRTRWI